eukprot:TRINITY_DN10553_c0_g1_i1.p1 TRINITY_DN10553_c0_g1~~TRINITY_DN10553_c0_g1_i1.p1  ORF type:complete len:780 (-),score=104.60 TRINITY_DN10553_c0_g1_i1:118-2457(-)
MSTPLISEDESLRFDETSEEGNDAYGTFSQDNSGFRSHTILGLFDGPQETGMSPSSPTGFGEFGVNKGALMEMWETYKAAEPTDPAVLWKEDKALFWKEMLKRCPYYFFPVLLWLPKYRWREHVVYDIVAGISVACMIVPQCLAYALLAKVPPEMGLYAGWAPLLVYFCMGTSRHGSIGPDALPSLLIGLYISSSSIGMAAEHLAPVYSFLVGLLLLVFGTFRLGFLDNILSRPLLAGFVNAVAVLMFIEQSSTILGIPPAPHHFDYSWQTLAYTFENITHLNWTAFLTGLLCLSVMIIIRTTKRHFSAKLPFLKFVVETLIVVILSIILSYTLDFEAYGVTILGAYKSSFPIPEVPKLTWESFSTSIGDAVVICIVGFVESIVAMKIYANKHNYQISPNRELVALGTSNFVGSFFKAYPTFISLTRSSIADSMGAQSQMFSLFASFIVLVVIFFGNHVFYYLPKVSMSAIILVAASTLLELEDLHFLWKIKAYKDLCLLIFTFCVTVALGVDIGIFISIGISLLMIVKHTTVPHIAILGKDYDGRWVDVYEDKEAKIIPGILVVRIEEGLYYGNIGQLKEMFKRIEKFGSHYAHPTDEASTSNSLKAIIIHTKNVVGLDATAVQILSEMMEEYHEKNIFVGFVKLRPKHKDKFLLSGIISSLGGDRLFTSTDDAVDYAMDYINISVQWVPVHPPQLREQYRMEREKKEAQRKSASRGSRGLFFSKQSSIAHSDIGSDVGHLTVDDGHVQRRPLDSSSEELSSCSEAIAELESERSDIQ